MKLSTKQIRLHKLVILLCGGKEVKSEQIMAELNCSAPTFTRALREFKEEYDADVIYKKSSQSYLWINNESISDDEITIIKKQLSENKQEVSNNVVISKPSKRAISASIDSKLIRKLNRTAVDLNKNRSEILEVLIRNFGSKEQLSKLFEGTV